MKPIRHLISIVFLLCGLTALGSERGYDRNDLVGTYKYNDTKEYVLNLHLHSDNTFMVSSAASDDSFRHFGNWEKELKFLTRTICSGDITCRKGMKRGWNYAGTPPKESSPKRKSQKEVWKDLIEQVVQEVVG